MGVIGDMAMNRALSDDRMRLMSIKGDLLGALEGLLAVAEMTTFSDQYPTECEAARAAIARAKGEA